MSALPVFERLAVVGLGLVGGSAALAALERGAAGEIRAVDPGLEDAGEIPLVSIEEAAGWADGVLLAVPIEAMANAMSALAPHLGPATPPQMRRKMTRAMPATTAATTSHVLFKM